MKQDFEINLEYNKSTIINKTLCLNFDIKTVNFSKNKIDKNEILKEIKKQIPKGEEKYFIVNNYSNKSVSFLFNINKWFEAKQKLIETENRYVKRLVLEKIPTLILNNINAIEYTKVIEESFRNYLLKNEKLKTKISNSVAEQLPIVYYRFKYDGNLNAIKIEVKEQFRHNIMAVLRSKKNSNKKLKKMDFDSSVETYLKFTKKKKG